MRPVERRTTGDGARPDTADARNAGKSPYGQRAGTDGAAAGNGMSTRTVPSSGNGHAKGWSNGNGAPVSATVSGSAAGEAARTPVTITNAGAARQYVRSVVGEHWNVPGGRVGEQAVIDLLLVVSELVTNAIRHGGGIAGFEVTPTSEGVRLSVRDHSDVVPAVAFGPGTLPSTHVGHGYGWPLIIRLARDIDIRPRPGGGKTISVYVPLVR